MAFVGGTISSLNKYLLVCLSMCACECVCVHIHVIEFCVKQQEVDNLPHFSGAHLVSLKLMKDAANYGLVAFVNVRSIYNDGVLEVCCGIQCS